MTGPTFKIEGLRELQANLQSLGPKIEKRVVRAALLAGARVALPAVKKSTYATGIRRRTGLLKDGLGVRMIKASQAQGRIASGLFVKETTARKLGKMLEKGLLRTRRSKKGEVKLVTKPFYWKFLEFGTKNIVATPYVNPAFKSVAAKMLDRYREVFAKGVERAAGQRPNK